MQHGMLLKSFTTPIYEPRKSDRPKQQSERWDYSHRIFQCIALSIVYNEFWETKPLLA